MKFIRANKTHLSELVQLFDAYRIFYKETSDLSGAERFLSDRFEYEDSVIFVAIDEEDSLVGFTQLYPVFSSVSMQRLYILNDLYVSNKVRGRGIGNSLLDKAKEFVSSVGAKGMTLETAIDNPAQHLYERNGWKKDEAFFHYSWRA